VPPPASAHATEWPIEWEGRALRPLALSGVEARFVQGFPGRIARFTDGEQALVLRDVRRPTRLLHPIDDCYRASGFRLTQTRIERDDAGRLWRCFVAERGSGAPSQRLRVCERIVDADGHAFTDTSSWFWAAQLGRSRGPWRAMTTARPV